MLKFISDIKIEKFSDSDDLVVEFVFSENPFFDNDSLSIRFVIDEQSDFDCGVIEIKSDQIDWKP